MSNNYKPIDNHTKHYSKEELRRRKEAEITVNFNDLIPPDYLDKKLSNEFKILAYKLLDCGIITELDEETLARYLLSKQAYLKYTAQLNKSIGKVSIEELKEIQKLQDKAFIQTRHSANDLGLSVKARCQLVTNKPKEVEENKFNNF